MINHTGAVGEELQACPHREGTIQQQQQQDLVDCSLEKKVEVIKAKGGGRKGESWFYIIDYSILSICCPAGAAQVPA